MTDQESDRTLEERIARLEREVAHLKQLTSPRGRRPEGSQRSDSTAGARKATAGAAGTAGPRQPPPKPRREPIDWSARAEGMLGRVGVVFVVLALGFLFKYSLDQGWITPAFRVLLGVAVGVGLITVGLRLEETRRRYAALLLGGGVAVLYLSGFAAHQLYGLVPWAIAFSFMAAVTVVALVLAERQEHPSLASIGASGGLSTPLLLESGSSNITGLVAFTCLILLGAGAVQFRKAWRSLLLVLALGGLIILAIATDRGGDARIVTQIGVLVLWGVTAVSPLVRRWLHGHDSSRWPVPSIGALGAARGATVDRWLMRILAVGVSLAVGLMMQELWGWDSERLGWLLITAFASAFVVLAWRLADVDDARDVSAEAASVLAAIGMWVAIAQEWVPPVQAAQAGLLLLLAKEWGLKGLAPIGHILFALLGFWFFGMALEPIGLSGVADWLPKLLQLGAVALAFACASLVSARLKRLYQLGAHVGFLLWVYAALAMLSNGQAMVTVVWGVYGIALLVGSFVLDNRSVQFVGLATLALVAGKLVLVDMAQLDMIWRILMFFGFGGAFLVLSYAVNRRSGGTPEPSAHA